MKVTYSEEAIADIVEAITYLNERNPAAAASLDAEVARCIERLAAHEFDGPVSRLRSGSVVRSWAVPPFRVYYQRHPDELLIVRDRPLRPAPDRRRGPPVACAAADVTVVGHLRQMNSCLPNQKYLSPFPHGRPHAQRTGKNVAQTRRVG